MTNKDQISIEELQEIIQTIFTDYITHYQANKMTFTEFAIIENILVKLDLELSRRGISIE